MRVDNQSTRNARGEITQQQARRLLAAAQAIQHAIDCGRISCAQCSQLETQLHAAINDITTGE